MNTITGQRGWVIAFCAYFALLLVIFALAYLHLIPVQIAAFPLYDKLGHALLLGLAAYLGHRASGRRHIALGRVALPLAPLLVALFALADECLQSFSPYRTFDVTDLTADALGIVLFYGFDWFKRPLTDDH